MIVGDHQERRSCPQCGAQVGPKSSKRVVPLFLATLMAKDTGELETARNLLDEEKRLRKQVSLFLSSLLLQAMPLVLAKAAYTCI